MIPSRELTYPTWGKGKIIFKSALVGDMLVPRTAGPKTWTLKIHKNPLIVEVGNSSSKFQHFLGPFAGLVFASVYGSLLWWIPFAQISCSLINTRKMSEKISRRDLKEDLFLWYMVAYFFVYSFLEFNRNCYSWYHDPAVDRIWYVRFSDSRNSSALNSRWCSSICSLVQRGRRRNVDGNRESSCFLKAFFAVSNRSQVGLFGRKGFEHTIWHFEFIVPRDFLRWNPKMFFSKEIRFLNKQMSTRWPF